MDIPTTQIPQRNGLWLIFLLRLLTSAVFAFFFSSLALYLDGSFDLSSANISSIVGLFLAANYFLPSIAGYIGDKLIEYKHLFILGNILRGVGCLLLIFWSKNFLYLSLSFYLVGSMANTLCLNVYVSELTASSSSLKRKNAFVWNYAGMNIGFMLGFIVAGAFGLKGDYHSLFIIMFVLIILTMLLAGKLPMLSEQKSIMKTLTGFAIISALLILLWVFLSHALSLRPYVIILYFGALMVLLTLSKNDRQLLGDNALRYFVFFMILSILFWTVYMITPIALLVMIKHDISLKLFGYPIAPQWLEGIDPIVIVLFSPCVVYLTNKLRQKFNLTLYPTILFGLGLILVSVSAALIFSHFPQISPEIILLYFVFLCLAEICIGPTGYSLVASISPGAIKGRLMGAWIMNGGIASILASYLSGYYLMPYIQTGYHAREFKDIFSIIMILTFLIGVATIVMTRSYKKFSIKNAID